MKKVLMLSFILTATGYLTAESTQYRPSVILFVSASRLHAQWREHLTLGLIPIIPELAAKCRKVCASLIKETGASAILIYDDTSGFGGSYNTIDADYDITQQVVERLNREYIASKQQENIA